MFANRFTVVIDACSLVDTSRRNLLLSLAEAELYRPRWSEEILGETERALAKIFGNGRYNIPNPDERAEKSVNAIRRAFPCCSEVEYSHLEPCITGLPDSKDNHVLAAAVSCKAHLIVTENLKHFPNSILEKYELEAKSADDFISDSTINNIN